jgi:adenosine deaminase
MDLGARLVPKKHTESLAKLRDALAKERAFIGQVPKGLSVMLVGLDYFGDEFKHPYCSFTDKDFIDFLLIERKNRDGHFGFRYHCGECDEPSDARTQTFLPHMAISSKAIIDIIKAVKEAEKEAVYKAKPFLRIGHGIGFHHYLQSALDTRAADPNLILIHDALELMRDPDFPIFIEINLSSNEYLADQTVGAPFKLMKSYFVTVSTDNDGIWPCEFKWEINQRSYVSVAAEYARAITGNVYGLSLSGMQLSKKEVSSLVIKGKAACFAPFPSSQ